MSNKIPSSPQHNSRQNIMARLLTMLTTCLSTKRSRALCLFLIAPTLLALAVPTLNVHIVYPAFKDIITTSIREDAERLGRFMLPPALKHSELSSESINDAMYGTIYKLENDFGLMKIKVFSPEGTVLYSTDPREIGSRNTKPYFKEVVARGGSFTKLVSKNNRTLDNNLVQTDVVETYVSIMNNDRFLGAIEFYYDVTKRMERLNQLITYSKIAMGLMSVSLLLTLLFLLRKEAHHVREKQRADALKEDVERITRHDMKSPVLSLLSGIAYLEQFTKLDNEQEELLSDMRHAANAAMEMINSSLDLYKMETGTYAYAPADMDLLAVARRAATNLSGLAQTYGVDVLITLAGIQVSARQTMPIKADASLCYALIANLVKNAIEASPEGETVTIALSEDNDYRMTVHNKGSVPEEVRGNFFDKYATAGKTTGTGLGTYSARLMTETMGGMIAMHTSETEGTILTVTLPRIATAKE